MPATGPSFYTRVFPANMTVSSGDIPGIVAFQVTAPSNGGQYWIDGHGPWPLRANFSMKVPKRIEVDAFGTRRAIPCPVQFQSGATSALEVLFVMDSDPENEDLGGSLDVGSPAAPLYQEGDTIPTASATVVGQMAAPALFRNTSTGKLIIPSTDASGNLVVSGSLGGAVISDTSSGAGAGLDSGIVPYSTSAKGLFIEIVASVALTGSRTIDLRMVRGDSSQYSLFDPVANTAATFSMAIGRLRYFATVGTIGSQPLTAASAFQGVDNAFVFPFPAAASVNNAFRVVIGAGGAEVVRLRLIQQV